VLFSLCFLQDGDPFDVNQRIAATTDFGKTRKFVQKQTDVAWNSSEGLADWNYRMKWRLKIPSKFPRIKLAMWNENMLTDSLLIGECIYDLAPFFTKCMKDKKPISKTDQRWVPFKHPKFIGADLGEVLIEFWLLTETEADKAPVGEAQNEPNRDPYLKEPKRKPPPWAIGTKGLAALGRWKTLIMIAIALVVVGGLAVALVVPIAAGAK
jgi:hypothetical protein